MEESFIRPTGSNLVVYYMFIQLDTQTILSSSYIRIQFIWDRSHISSKTIFGRGDCTYGVENP
jgi:hypothetical protein